MIEFLVNQTRHHCMPVSADITLLEYLREHLHRCGTKEGCASGDCGACTVVIASADSESSVLEYRAVNACITFASSVAGQQVLTVEDLADESGLHPVQQAMRDFHASQCGFCTPGIVMSMFALWKNVSADKVAKPIDGNWIPTVEEHLGGNLCRCTGYRPIVDACVECLQNLNVQNPNLLDQGTDHFDRDSEQTFARLHQLRNVASSDSEEVFFIPQTLPELDDVLAQHADARVVAGGTDLALEVTQELQTVSPLVCLQQISELQVIEHDNDRIRIGAGISLTELQRLLVEQLGCLGPDFDELLHRFGSTPVRNQGTLGGNIANASPIGDLPPVLLALNAELVLYRQGQDRTVAMDQFFTGYRTTLLQPGEIIRAVVIPGLAEFRGSTPESTLRVYKISKRFDDDISALCMAAQISLQGERIAKIRLAFGGMAAIPQRALAVEAVLSGQQLNDDSVLAAAQSALNTDFQPIDDVRASADYRLQVARNLLVRLRYELLKTDQPVRIAHYGNQ